jgi:hypothetical protein
LKKLPLSQKSSEKITSPVEKELKTWHPAILGFPGGHPSKI